MVANLPPSERSKIKNVLPVAVVPGPKSPGNLVSFLEPLLQELEHLGQGREVTMWDGSRKKIRVHLLFATADLPAVAKLCYLKGHWGLSPYRFCSIKGIFVPGRNRVYYPNKVSLPSSSKQGKVTKRLWKSQSLPLRTEAQVVRELK